MPTFQYIARDRSGAPLSGVLAAASRREALRILNARGLTPVSVSESDAPPGKTTAAPSRKQSPARKQQAPAQNKTPTAHASLKSLSSRERLPFLQALLDLTSSGMSAGEAIRLLSLRLKEPRLRTLCQNLWEQISEGAPLSRALAAHPRVFNESCVNLIAAGEATGSINETLGRIIEQENENQDMRRQVVSAMAYPVFMMCVATAVIAFFLFYLLPKMESLLKSLGGRLPTPTRILIGFSDFVVHFGPFIAVGLVLAILSFWKWKHTESGRRNIDLWTLKLPIIAGLATAKTVLAISQTLGSLLENGITTAEALKMTERQISNKIHQEAFAQASSRVMEGEALSLALGRTHCFPDLILDRLAVGENTGNIVPSLKDISRRYQKQITLQLNGATRVLTTIFMLGVFIFIGFIAFAIVSAVLSMSSGFQMH